MVRPEEGLGQSNVVALSATCWRTIMTTKKVVYRDSGTGRLVTQDYAKSHPKTTEREHVYVPAPKTTPSTRKK